MNKHLIVCIALLAACLGNARAGLAQTALISLELARSTPPLRSDSPMTFVWKIQSQSTKLIEGQLDVTIHDGSEVLGHSVVDDVVLTLGEQLVRTVLPPIESHNQFGTLELRVRFFSKNVLLGDWKLDLRAPNQWQRNLVILVCDPWQANLPGDARKLIDRLRVETWNADTSDRTITSIPAHVRPDDLPADPLGYCGFDLVLLTNEGLGELKESQMQPLLEWVEAGGSLCIVPGTVGLKDYHVRFLNRAARASDGNPQFVVDSSGRLMGSGSPHEAAGDAGGRSSESAALLRHYGLGRVAIISGKLDRLLTEHETDLRPMLAFLWKMRHDRQQDFFNSGTFVVTIEHPVDEPKPGDNDWQARNFNVTYAKLRPKDRQLASLPLQSGDELLTQLMPEGLRVVPMSLIGVILVVYVLLIGPGDWFVLGAIKRRKWTWCTFPCVTVALTLFTVWLAEWYMQVSDNRRVVTFHDVGAEGRVARRNRFEVLFQGSERNVTTELNREIFSAMTLQRFSSAQWFNYQQQQLQGVDQRRTYTQVANVVGRVPARYTVTQFLSQWTPQLNRRFSIIRTPAASAAAAAESEVQVSPASKTDKLPEFDWNQFADSKTHNAETLLAVPLREALVKQVRQSFGESAHIALCIEGKRQVLAGNFAFLHSGPVYGVDANGNPINNPYQPYNPRRNGANATQTSFLDDVSVNRLGGLFDVVSQISPTGGKDFEDMALLDPTDPDQWLLIVAVDRGAAVDVYRKLYAKED